MLYKVLYYHYFIFYKKTIRSANPHLLTILVLSLSFSMFINGILGVIASYYYCYFLGKWFMLSVLAFLILITYFFFYKTGKALDTVNSKPKIFGSDMASASFTLLFFISTALLFLITGLLTKNILDNCK